MDKAPVTGTAAIEFIGVDKRFPARGKSAEVLAARDIHFSIAKGEVVSIIGPSGCGKSTLLNMGAGLSKPSAGTVKVNGEVVSGPNKHVAFMLQKDLLMPWRTIAQNVEFGLELSGVPHAERQVVSTRLLNQCHLKGFGQHYPNQLSGGMRQRAALARTLAVDPLVLLMDEPFSALDAQTKMILQQDLAQTVQSEGKTVVFITHDLAEAVTLSDRILVMSERPGTLIEEIRVDIPDRANPMQRRKHPLLADYVSRLMALLKLDAQADVH
ncbi:MAG: ABC transporter ATP-binding protein [Limnohabitans sp.]|jgi:NitT/TauT family transport system ATP-binding protein|uniref:ABC transporter ATP-binding protein n=1 Tax=Limnohabitans sp. TaxID=1907725 RepID=UPI00391917EA